MRRGVCVQGKIKPRQGLSNLIKRNAGLFREGSATGNRPAARAARCGNKRNPAASRFPSRFHAKQSREFVPRPAIIPPAFRLSRVYSPRRLLPPADSRLISPIPVLCHFHAPHKFAPPRTAGNVSRFRFAVRDYVGRATGSPPVSFAVVRHNPALVRAIPAYRRKRKNAARRLVCPCPCLPAPRPASRLPA